MSSRPAAHGFSLVELLVAMVLGLLLINGLVVAFAGNKRASDVSTATATMQENVRFALGAIAADIRMAGHQGCLDFSRQQVAMTAATAPTANFARTAVSGAQVVSASDWQPALALGSGGGAFSPPTSNTAVPGTHVIALQFGGPSSAGLATSMNVDGVADASAPLELDGDLGLSTGDHALVSTCEDGEIFTVTGVTSDENGRTTLSHAAPANLRGNFNQVYGTGRTAEQVRVMPFRTHVYYIGETGREDERGEPVRALYQQSMPFNDASNPPVELVSGIENLRLSFGINSSGDDIRYVTPGAAGYDPTRVVSVRVGILASSDEHMRQDADTTTYVLAGRSVPSAANPTDASAYKSDERLRLAFNTTVKVRNRRGLE